jgi:hypothetical protein
VSKRTVDYAIVARLWTLSQQQVLMLAVSVAATRQRAVRDPVQVSRWLSVHGGWGVRISKLCSPWIWSTAASSRTFATDFGRAACSKADSASCNADFPHLKMPTICVVLLATNGFAVRTRAQPEH